MSQDLQYLIAVFQKMKRLLPNYHATAPVKELELVLRNLHEMEEIEDHIQMMIMSEGNYFKFHTTGVGSFGNIKKIC